MKRTLVLSLAVSALLYGCTQPIATVEETTPVSRNMFNEEVLAPLNFEQMREIVAGVLGDEAASRITPTSRYVRVQFNNADRMCEYSMRGAAELLPEPLLGETYTEVSASADRPRPMYGLIERDVPMPEAAECEVLEEYFDPTSPLSGLTEAQAAKVNEAVMNNASMTRAGIDDYNWYPSGRIEIYDDLAGTYIPVSGVPVVVTGYKANSGTTLQVETCTTDSEGRYTCKKQFLGFVSEQVKWANSYWSIMEDSANIAFTYSPILDRKAWNLIITSSTADRAMQFASAYRAANYMHNNGYRISNLKGTSAVNIRCLDEAIPANNNDRFEQVSDSSNTMVLYIYCKRKSAFDIYNVVQRELGKAVHNLRINASTNDYRTFNKIMRESWGEFTNYYFAQHEYRGLNALNKIQTYAPEYQGDYGYIPFRPDALNRQEWFYNTQLDASSQCRTPLFIDILDDFDQGIWPENFSYSYMKYPQDEFFSLLIGGFSDFEEWSRYCKNVAELKEMCFGAVGPYGTPREAINKLFTVYEELEAAL